ncbi:MAG: malate synthase A, partial [Chloroflexi bacterium]|nr:malate synthase A [Chloroflexota bacterium]
MTISSAAGVEVRGPRLARFDEVLTGPGLEFVGRLHREFNPQRERLLQARQDVQARLDAGELPTFPSDTASIRDGEWTVAPVKNPDLQKRWVELTGPTERKMLI